MKKEDGADEVWHTSSFLILKFELRGAGVIWAGGAGLKLKLKLKFK